MNHKNTKKSPNHENADVNITCNFRDGDISRLGVVYLTHVIDRYIDLYIASWIIVRCTSNRIKWSMFNIIDATDKLHLCLIYRMTPLL